MSARQTGCLGFGKSSFMGAVGADTLTGEGDGEIRKENGLRLQEAWGERGFRAHTVLRTYTVKILSNTATRGKVGSTPMHTSGLEHKRSARVAEKPSGNKEWRMKAHATVFCLLQLWQVIWHCWAGRPWRQSSQMGAGEPWVSLTA